MATPFIVIIEDDPKQGDIFSLSLEIKGFQTELIQDGWAALTRLKQIIPDLVLLDLNLPGVSGGEILQYIRTQPQLAHVPVVITSADSNMTSALEDQATLTLLKPVSPEQLVTMVRRLTE